MRFWGNFVRTVVLGETCCALRVLRKLVAFLGSWGNLLRSLGLGETCRAQPSCIHYNAHFGSWGTFTALWGSWENLSHSRGNFARTWGPGLALGDAWQHLALEGEQLSLPLHELIVKSAIK